MIVSSSVLLLLALVVGGCGSDDNQSSNASGGSTTVAQTLNDRATLSGAGSTFVQTILQEWIKQFKAVDPGVTINYQGVGSGAGVQQLTAKTVDFAGSDGTLKPEEQAATGGAGAVVQLPWIAGGVAVEYNLSGVDELKLSGDTVAGIFAGRIQRWNDPAIKADNPDASLPGTSISVVHRSDGSGTTNVFTSYLKAVAPAIWTETPSKDWPNQVGTGAKGSDGVTAQVKQQDGAIGYAEVSFANQSNLGVAKVKNAAGKFVGPTNEAVSAAIAEATVNPDNTLKINYTPAGEAAYPISTTTYLMYYKAGTDSAKATALTNFAKWVLTDGQRYAKDLDYAAMPQSILDKLAAAL
jgi:phosphate transport system substrate-binding protein